MLANGRAEGKSLWKRDACEREEGFIPARRQAWTSDESAALSSGSFPSRTKGTMTRGEALSSKRQFTYCQRGGQIVIYLYNQVHIVLQIIIKLS